jgi:hypothetical protein
MRSGRKHILSDGTEMQLMSVFATRLPERSERELAIIERELYAVRALLRYHEARARQTIASPGHPSRGRAPTPPWGERGPN